MFRGSYINYVFSGFPSFLVQLLVHELGLFLLDNRKISHFVSWSFCVIFVLKNEKVLYIINKYYIYLLYSGGMTLNFKNDTK